MELEIRVLLDLQVLKVRPVHRVRLEYKVKLVL
jgi:hypothetical protein